MIMQNSVPIKPINKRGGKVSIRIRHVNEYTTIAHRMYIRFSIQYAGAANVVTDGNVGETSTGKGYKLDRQWERPAPPPNTIIFFIMTISAIQYASFKHSHGYLQSVYRSSHRFIYFQILKEKSKVFINNFFVSTNQFQHTRFDTFRAPRSISHNKHNLVQRELFFLSTSK